VRDPRLEAGQRGHRADHLLIAAVAGIDDPVMIGELAEDLERSPRHAAPGGRRAQAPLPQTQRLGDQAAVEPSRGEVVVVGEGQVDRVVGKQAEGLIWLVLTDAKQHGGMPLRQEPDDRQHGFAHGGSERRHPHRAGGRRRRV
jgi:hypothetical protein